MHVLQGQERDTIKTMSEGYHYCRRFSLTPILSHLQENRIAGDVPRWTASTISAEDAFEFIFTVVESLQTNRSKAE
jgi:hypothetical protein